MMKRLVPIALLLLSLHLQAKEVRMSYAQPGYACYPYTETTFSNLCNSAETCRSLFTCAYQQADFVAKAPVPTEMSILNGNTLFNRSQHFWSQPPSIPPMTPKDPSSAEMVKLQDWLWCKLGVDTFAFMDQVKKNVSTTCIPSFSNSGADIQDLDLIHETQPIQKGTYERTDKPPVFKPRYAVFPITLDSAQTAKTIQIDEPLHIGNAEYNGVLSLADTKGKPLLGKPFQEIILLDGKVSGTDPVTSTLLTPSSVFKEKYKDSCAIIINSAHPVVIQNIALKGFEAGICITRKTEVVLSKVSTMGTKIGIRIIDKTGTMETDAAGNPKGFVPEDTANPNKATWILVADSFILSWYDFIQISGGANKPLNVIAYNSIISGQTHFTQDTQRMVVIKGSLSDSWAAPTWGQEKAPLLVITTANSDKSNGTLKFLEDVTTNYPSKDGYSAIVYVANDEMEFFKTTQILHGSDVQVNKNIVTLNGINTKNLGPQAQVMVALIPSNLADDDRAAAKALFTTFVNQGQEMKLPPVSFPYAYSNTLMGPRHSITICGDQDNPTLKAKLQNANTNIDHPLKPAEPIKIRLPWGPSKTINLAYKNDALHVSGNDTTFLEYNGTFAEVFPESTVTLAMKSGSSRPKIVVASTDISDPCTASGIQWDEDNKIKITNYDTSKTARIVAVKSGTLTPPKGSGSLEPNPISGGSNSDINKGTPATPAEPTTTPVGPVTATSTSPTAHSDNTGNMGVLPPSPNGIKKPFPKTSGGLNSSQPGPFGARVTPPEGTSGGSCGLIR